MSFEENLSLGIEPTHYRNAYNVALQENVGWVFGVHFINPTYILNKYVLSHLAMFTR